MYDDLFQSEIVEDMEVAEGDWIVNGLVPTEGLTIIDGKPKSGKSTLALGLGMSVAQGTPFAGDPRFAGCLDGIPSKVLYVGTDGRWKRELGKRQKLYPAPGRENLHATDGRKAGLVFPGGHGPAFDKTTGQWQKFAAWGASHGFRVVILDHLLKLAGARGVNDGDQIAPVLSALEELVSVGIVPILIHHSSMHSNGEGRAMGHTIIHATMRSGLSVQDPRRGTGEQVVNVLTNEAAEMSLVLQRLEGKPPVVLDWTERVTRKEAKAKRERQPRTDINIVRVQATLAAPEAARASRKAAAEYLQGLGPKVMGKATNGYQVVGSLVRDKMLLAEASNGEIVAGPKWAA
ncbi:MAG: AAA family ATPase [Candidatus Nanopelagicales bacterium]